MPSLSSYSTDIQIKSAPSITMYNGVLYCAYRGEDSGLFIISSEDGLTWTPPVYVSEGTSASPALGVLRTYVKETNLFSEKLVCLFQANNDDQTLLVIDYDAENNTWSNNKNTGFSTLGGAKVIGYDGKLYAAFVNINNKNIISVITSEDGETWSQTEGNTGQYSNEAPGIAILEVAQKTTLYCTYAEPSFGHLYTVSTSDETGKDWSDLGSVSNNSTGSSPDLLIFNNQLYCAFQSNDPSNRLLLVSSKDGKTWSQLTDTLLVTEEGPSMAADSSTIYFAYNTKDKDKNNLSIGMFEY